MLAGNMRTQPMSMAVSRTFDGLHPCCLCKAIASAKKTEQKNELKLPVVRLEFAPYASAVIIPTPPAADLVSPVESIFTAITHPPLLPPPRTVQVC
jgi:hypothetical protein